MVRSTQRGNKNVPPQPIDTGQIGVRLGACCLSVGHDGRMSRDWKRLAEAIRAARRELGMTQVELADAADVSGGTIQNLEAGREFYRIPTKLPAVERALEWAPGSAKAVLDGGDPTPLVPRERSPEGGARAFHDPRMQAIWDLDLPLEERIEGIRDLMEADLRRAQQREERRRDAG